ncbi:MAG: hypothetical protein IKF18_04760 [Erysipelotrichaceae bacterium]|nr:hypothetical protein [Erysipelotrichaceae bacterium]MBR3167979.1 hypothetical protein [Erysipelotrichaceae bacterium]
MKKLLCILFALFLLLSGCSQKAKTPQELLEEAYSKAEELDSMTVRGTTDVTISSGTELAIPLDLVMMVEKNDKKDASDDLTYAEVSMELFGQKMETKTWTQNGTSYVENAEGKYTTTMDSEAAASYDTAAIAKTIAENAESIEMTKSGDSTVITVKPTEKLINAMFANSASAEGITGELLDNEAFENMTFSDIIITLGKEGYVDNVKFSASGAVEGVDMTVAIDLNVTDRNTTKVPAFDPADFADEPVVEPEPLDYADDSKILEITFSDDGVTAGFEAAESSDIALYYEEEEGYIDVFDSSFENMRAFGMFVNAALIEELMEDVRTGKDGYQVLDDVQSDIGPFLVGYAPQETDVFNPDTIFICIRYEGYDLGYLMAGLSDQDDFYDVIENLTFYTK